MCGIGGILALEGTLTGLDLAALGRMSASVAHRGPDDEGYALIARRSGTVRAFAGPTTPELSEPLPPFSTAGPAPEADLALLHRRFSIFDPSPAGHQPFLDPAGEVCAVFNGEVYNWVELRAELEAAGHRFRTRCDTEVLVAAFREWGRACFERFNGMWAVAIYDARSGELVLARDRLGQRPLYLASGGGRLLFASEIKALRAHPAVDGDAVSGAMVAAYLRSGLRDVDGRTFYEAVESLPPGTSLAVGPDGAARSERYWSLPVRREAAGGATARREAARELRRRLTDAVRLRLRADVPIAFELSGGMDSSALVALARDEGHEPTAYTVTYDDPRFDESPFAREVARRYGLDHRILTPRLDRFWDEADDFVALQEEPFHSVNVHVNQWLRRQIRADGHRVLISGAAGDELFAGYHEYLLAYLRGGEGGRRASPGERAWIFARHLVPHLAGHARDLLLDPGRAYRRLTEGPEPGTGALADRLLAPALRPLGRETASYGLEGLLRANMERLKLPYWLAAGDKTNMGIPIEPRVPFLDPGVVELAFRMPAGYLVRRGWTKWILRKAVEDVVPRPVTWRRKKMGFPVPLGDWLGANRERVVRVFREMDNPYLERGAVLDGLDHLLEHRPPLLWRALSLELWHRRVIRGESLAEGAGASAREAR